MSYNFILTTLETNIIVKHVVPIVMVKSALTCTNCGKTGDSIETCHNYYNRKKKVPLVPTTTIESTEPGIRTKTQPIKSGKIPIRYPFRIYYIVERKSRKCPKRIEVQNMFRTKLVSFNVTTTPKQPKTNNVPINVVAIVTSHSHQSK